MEKGFIVYEQALSLKELGFKDLFHMMKILIHMKKLNLLV